MQKSIVIHDLQFGSAGKGQIAGALAYEWEPDSVVCAYTPNTGHSFCHPNGNKYIHTALPIGALAPSCQHILIGPGAVVNIQSLISEISLAGDLVRGKHLYIHPQASILMPGHMDIEKAYVRIGSTMKGTAAAYMHKMARDPKDNPTLGFLLCADVESDIAANVYRLDDTLAESCGVTLHVTSEDYNRAVDASKKMLVEGAQGHSLGIHTDFYPHTTSRDVSLMQLWADCRLPLRDIEKPYVIGICRTFPIRVANRYDANGFMVGTSGPSYPDQDELDWKDLGREPELTTVTKLPRRIFTFSFKQIADACRISAPDAIALTFCDYLYNGTPDVGWPPGTPIRQLVANIEAVAKCPVRMLQFGPKVPDLFELRNATIEKAPMLFLKGV